MGILGSIKDQMVAIGKANGSCIPTTFGTVHFSGEGQDRQLTIRDGNNELFSFKHEDVKYACICVVGQVDVDGNNKPIYGVKYRVELNDGKTIILTAAYNSQAGKMSSILKFPGPALIENVIF